VTHVYCDFINYRTKKSTRRIRRLRHKQPRLPTHRQQNTQKGWNKGGTSSGEHETFPPGRGPKKKNRKGNHQLVVHCVWSLPMHWRCSIMTYSTTPGIGAAEPSPRHQPTTCRRRVHRSGRPCLLAKLARRCMQSSGSATAATAGGI
jgi:hypothetical protein